jgi:penicillin-binding protein 1C
VVDSTWVIGEALRTTPCPYHVPILVNAAGTHRTRPGPGAHTVPWFVLPAAMEHYLTQWDRFHRPLPPWEDASMARDEQGIMEVVYPEQGARLYVPLLLEGVHGTVVLQAAHRDAEARVHWDLGGRYLGHTEGDHRLPAELPPGPQRLTLTDEKGRSCSVSFQVVRNSGDPGTSPYR